MDLFKLVGKVAVKMGQAHLALSEAANGVDAASRSALRYGEVVAAMGATVVAAVTAACGKAYSIAGETADRLNQISVEANSAGVGTAWYQDWAYIAQRCNTDISTVVGAVQKMSVKVGEGKDDTKAALEALGLSLEAAQQMAPEDLFETVITSLAGLEDPYQKAEIANQLLGTSWKQLADVLSLSAADVAALKADKANIAPNRTDEEIEMARQFSEAMIRLQTAAQAVKDALGVTLLSSLTAFVNWLTGLFTWGHENGEWMRQASQQKLTELESYGTDHWGYLWHQIQSIPGAFRDSWDHAIAGKYGPFASSHTTRSGKFGRGSASGLDYVPYDEFPALLHTGETVLTAREAEEWRRAQSSPPLNVIQYITAPSGNPAQIAQATTAALGRLRKGW